MSWRRESFKGTVNGTQVDTGKIIQAFLKFSTVAIYILSGTLGFLTIIQFFHILVFMDRAYQYLLAQFGS